MRYATLGTNCPPHPARFGSMHFDSVRLDTFSLSWTDSARLVEFRSMRLGFFVLALSNSWCQVIPGISHQVPGPKYVCRLSCKFMDHNLTAGTSQGIPAWQVCRAYSNKKSKRPPTHKGSRRRTAEASACPCSSAVRTPFDCKPTPLTFEILMQC